MDSILKILAEILLSHGKDFLLQTISQRNFLFTLISNKLDKIDHKLDKVLAEPYKSSMIFFKNGLVTSKIDFFGDAYKKAIEAFHLAQNIKEKYRAADLAIASIVLWEKEHRDELINVVINEFITDELVVGLFKFICDKKKSTGREIADGIIFLSLFLLQGTIVLIPLYFFWHWTHHCKYFPKIYVDWDRDAAVRFVSEPGIKKGVCMSMHDNNHLILFEMEDEVNDLLLVCELFQDLKKIGYDFSGRRVKLFDSIYWES